MVDRGRGSESSAAGKDQDANHGMVGRDFLRNLYVSHDRSVCDVVVFQSEQLVAGKRGVVHRKLLRDGGRADRVVCLRVASFFRETDLATQAAVLTMTKTRGLLRVVLHSSH